jgi:hypothetical protein
MADYSGYTNYTGQSGLNVGDVAFPPDAMDTFLDASLAEQFSTSKLFPDFDGDLNINTAFGQPAAAFTFITPPQDVQYSQGAQVEQVPMFGTNNPPLTVGSLNAGELNLGNALMEGFTLGKQVQKPLEDLQVMQEVVLDRSGFVNVPVWSVLANERNYGMFVIENIDISESMRDMTGRTTRAMVNVKFRQVAPYQVNTGRDQALSPSTVPAPPKTPDPQAASVAAATAAKSTPAATPAAAKPKTVKPGSAGDPRNYTVGGITYNWATGAPL